MSERSTEDQGPRSVSSGDGAEWDFIGAGTGPVTKAVVGKNPPREDADPERVAIGGEVRDDLMRWWGGFRELHLWQVDDLDGLLAAVADQGWPPGLQTLDLRGCDISHLPKLPESLEELDLGFCVQLSDIPGSGLSDLRRLYMEQCSNVGEEELRLFVKQCSSLEEFSLADCLQLNALTKLPEQSVTVREVPAHPAFPERCLKKIVLSGCKNLVSLPNLSSYRWLHHLNITDCLSLKTLPSISVESGDGGEMRAFGVQYLLNHGCDSLRTFGKLDVRPVHCSETPEKNAAPVFRTMRRLGDEATDLAMSKVLFLGSGRCGKTTVAKALQWKLMEGKEREENKKEDEADRRLDPSETQESTHGIHFWQWNRDFEFADGTRKDGIAHLWDFAGQEIYHNTHRLFASEGTVFVIVTTSLKIHDARIDAELRDKGIVEREEKAAFRRVNEYRELKYWLDYIRNALKLTSVDELKKSSGNVSIRIIHTGGNSTDEALDYLKEQAGAYQCLLDEGELRVEAIDFSEATWESKFGGMETWVRQSIGKATDQFGVRVPKLFADAANWCADEIAKGNVGERMLDFADWQRTVNGLGSNLQGSLLEQLGREQALATAEYLHQCGRIFWLRSKRSGDGQIIVNQQWGADGIYELALRDTAERIRPRMKGFLAQSEIKELFSQHCRSFARLLPEQQDLLLDLLDQCNICARVGDQWMAVQRELLPVKNASFEEQVQSDWDWVREGRRGMINHTLALHGKRGGLLGNSDYRDVLAFIVRGLRGDLPEKLFGDDQSGEQSESMHFREGDRQRERYSHRCQFWSDGFLVTIENHKSNERVALQIDWRPCLDPVTAKRIFAGGMFIQYLTPDEDTYVGRLRKILEGDGGPLEIFHERLEESDSRPPNLSAEIIGCRRGFGLMNWTSEHGPERPDLRHDVAISYKSAQKTTVVDPLVQALKKVGVEHVYEYSNDELYSLNDDYRKPDITEIYDYLKFAKILIVVASGEYFQSSDLDNQTNVYCPVELAEAITAHNAYSSDEKKRCSGIGDQRATGRVFWVGVEMSQSQIEGALEDFLRSYQENVTNVRTKKGQQTEIDIREIESINAALVRSDRLSQFKNDYGRSGKNQMVYFDPDETKWADDLSDRIRSVLNG